MNNKQKALESDTAAHLMNLWTIYAERGGTPIEELEILEAAYKALSQDQWLPISSAPRDGTEIILSSFVKTDFLLNDMGICYWRDDEVMQGWTWGCERAFQNPTHWQPLPQPPTGDKG